MYDVISQAELEAYLLDPAPNIPKKKAFMGTDFSSYDLSHATFRSCLFADCSFMGANLSKAKFIGCTWTNCNLQKVMAHGAEFDQFNFESCQMTESSFSEATLYNGQIIDTSLFWSNWSGSDIQDVLFRSCLISHTGASTDFAMSKLFNVTYELCDMTGVDFEYSLQKRIRFRVCLLNGAVFARCSITGATFESSIMEKSFFSMTRFHSSSFRYAPMQGGIFNKTILENCDFTQAVLDDAIWINVQEKNCEGLVAHD